MDARLIEEIEGQIRIATEAKWTAERLDAEDRAKRLLFGFATALLAAAREGERLREQFSTVAKCGGTTTICPHCEAAFAALAGKGEGSNG